MTDADNPTPESERGDILREHRAQSIEVDYGMLLARGQDAERTPGRHLATKGGIKGRAAQLRAPFP